ncbi:GNAT family N-acetyltransferase [Brevibacterium sp. 91QC2O2]|uniref:GNAT family N-acetyltransferase n=1 Tax=Brevibacterium sp. 91QC2O2 TaxID=2968458 RepID=UPI00211C6742|nr:GNAT family N-acetyltransferase [Brevibacterium sp. 91QC2O2]MCQ9368410.1 GNAT family N-acetyltransferase [Brevibacterium sp. 91QC2O2]
MLEPRIGMRIVVRRRIPDGSTDVLGEVAAVTDEAISLATKTGPQTVHRAEVELIHELPPAPQAAGPLHRIVSAADLRKVSAAVWLPNDVAWLNADNLRAEAAGAAGEAGAADAATVQTGWLLRAAGGVSSRGNSALPLPGSGLEAGQALDLVQQWYQDRGLPESVHIYSGRGTHALDEACAPLTPLFKARGFSPSEPTLTLTADTAAAAGVDAAQAVPTPAGLQIVLADAPHQVHFSAWGYGAEDERRAQFAQLVTSPQDFTILSAVATHPDGSKSLVGTARLAIAMKWAVVSNLVVAPGLRRRGAARSLVRTAAHLAARRGVRSVMAEVAAGNAASLGLFASLGFTEHHRYWYARMASAN